MHGLVHGHRSMENTLGVFKQEGAGLKVHLLSRVMFLMAYTGYAAVRGYGNTVGISLFN